MKISQMCNQVKGVTVVISLCTIFVAGQAAYAARANVSRSQLFSKDVKERRAALGEIERKKDKRFLRDIEKTAQEDSDASIRSTAIGALCRMGDAVSADKVVDIALSSPHEGDRRVAVSGLIMLLGKDRAIPILKQSLQDRDKVVKMRAAKKLGKVGDYSGEYIALEGTRSEDVLVWTEATEALGYISTEASKKRLEEIVSSNRPGSYTAKYALRRLEYQNSSNEKKISMARGDMNSDIRTLQYLACEMLADMGTPEAIQLLNDVSKDQNHPAWRAALSVLEFKGIITEEEAEKRFLTK